MDGPQFVLHPLRDILVLSSFLVTMNKATSNSHVKVFVCVILVFQISWEDILGACLLDVGKMAFSFVSNSGPFLLRKKNVILCILEIKT